MTEQNDTQREKQSEKQGWFILLCAGMFYLYEYILRVSPSVITEELMAQYHLTSAGFGMLVSFYYLAYVPLQIPCGYILDRFGLRSVITTSAALCTIGSFIFTFSDSFMMAKIGRFMMGAGSACAYVSCMKAGAEWFKPSKFALISGLTLMMGTIGATFGAHPFAVLVNNIGYKDAMAVMCYSGIFVTVLSFLVIRDRVKSESHEDSIPFLSSLSKVVRNPRNWILGIYGCLMYVGIAGFAELWSVTYLMKKYAILRTDAASLAITFFIGVAVGSPIIASFVEKYCDRIYAMAALGVLGAIVFSFILYTCVIHLSIIALLLFVQGALCGGHVLCFVAAKQHTDPRLSGTVLGFINALVMMSGLVFQPLIGYILDQSWDGKLAENGSPFYQISDFQNALITVLISYIAASIIILSIKFLKAENK